MSLNSTSSNYHDHYIFSINSINTTCLRTRPSSMIYLSYYITNILLLVPLSILVLYLGLQRQRQQYSNSTATMMSHSDCFTYHMVIMELFGVLGSAITCYAINSDQAIIRIVGFSFTSLNWYGETYFYPLTCVERHLAVVHPITYLSLRGERGVRIRNICIGCVWLLCVGLAIIVTVEGPVLFMDLCLIIFSVIIISFCSLSVLWVLIRPRPGEHGQDRGRVDQSKQRAFYTIMVILGALLVRCFMSLAWAILELRGGRKNCVSLSIQIWCNLPSSLVLPVLFLQRAGELTCCKTNTK